MKKTKKTNAPQQGVELERLAAKLHAALRCETTNIIEIGNILIESRKLLADEHGEWLPWLDKNFDRSERSAQRYIAAAEYVAKSDTVADFSNLSPSVLYGLAAGEYNEQEEAAILAATRKGRVDTTQVEEICDALAPVELTLDITDEIIEAAKAVEAAEDARIEAILDGPPPLPPPAPSTPTDFILRAFDQAVNELKRLMTKPVARFARTTHTTGDLEHIEDFIRTIRALADRVQAAKADPTPGGRVMTT